MSIPKAAILQAIEMRAQGESWETILDELKAVSPLYEIEELTPRKLQYIIRKFRKE